MQAQASLEPGREEPRLRSGRRLFIAHTPYHALLSWGIALSRCTESRNYLVLVGDAKGSDVLCSAMAEAQDRPFERCTMLPGIFGKTVQQKRFMFASNVRTIIRMTRQLSPQEVFVFNDGKPEAQAALHVARQTASARGIYVEDGAGVYWASAQPYFRPWFKKIAARVLLYGPWWEELTAVGTSRWIDEVIALFPEQLRSDLMRKPRGSIDRRSLINDTTKRMLEDYASRLGVVPEKLQDFDVLVIAAHSSVISDFQRYRELLMEFIHRCQEAGLRYVVKYHPREERVDYVGVPKEVLLPQEMPAELMYVLAGDRIRLVLGDQSTALISGKWLLPNARIVSAVPLLDPNNVSVASKLKSLGIELLWSMDQVDSIL